MRSRTPKLMVALVAFATLATACSSGDSARPEPTPTPDGTIIGVDGQSGSDGPSRFSIRLSQGSGSGAEADPVPVVVGEPLDPDEVAAVLARLPNWTPDPGDQVEFNRPPESLPPPLVGETIDQPFPLDDPLDPVDVPDGPLEILRFQPDGDVAIAPAITITFNQPMVPIATLGQLDGATEPARITPAVAGIWEWIGTRTARFEHDSNLIDRLPMATTYTVEVPAGTRSQTGGVLTESFTFSFETPTATLLEFGPTGENLPLEPVFHARFDQLVDAARALDAITLAADGEDVPLRLATQDEMLDAQLSRLVGDPRSIAFRPAASLPVDAALTVRIGPNLPSAEGPNTSSAVETTKARTYGPMEVVDQRCERRRQNDDCLPFSTVFISMSNPIDQQAFEPGLIEIEPRVANAAVAVFGTELEIRGDFNGRTDYTVTLDAALTDVYGQTLGRDTEVEFEFGDAIPRLLGPEREMVTLDPLGPPGLTFTVVNHDRLAVEVYEVSPDEFELYRDRSWEWAEGRREVNIGRRIRAFTVDTDAERDIPTDVFVDLEDDLDDGIGQLLVLVSPDPAPNPQRDDDYWASRPRLTWVQGTRIGIDRFADRDNAIVWSTDLRTGAPLGGVRVEWLGATGSATTDSDGTASLPNPRSASWGLVARSGSDTAFLTAWTEATSETDALKWYIFDDRSLYRPGETARVKGFVRRWTTSGSAQLSPVGTASSLLYTVRDPRGNEIASGTTRTSALGGFDFEFDLADDVNLGWAWIDLSLMTSGTRNQGAGHQFQIQEFRRPEFEVRARVESEPPHLRGEPSTVSVAAEYFAGGPLPDAEVTWRVTTRDATYSPPNWDEFQFGVWVPWWWYEGADLYGGEGGDYGGVAFDDYFIGPYDPGEVEEFSGRTDGSGNHYLRMDFGSDGDDLPVTVTAEAQVTDVNRQVWASTTNLLVHPGDLYVGLRGTNTFVRRGEPLDVEAIVTDIDGNAIAGRALRVTAERLDWGFVDGSWQEVPVETENCDVTTESEPVSCSFETDQGGQYRIGATVVDDEGRGSRTELTRWVAGGRARPDQNLRQEDVTLVPDADEYRPGDTAEILVQAPFAPAELLVTISRNGIESTRRLRTEDGSAVLEVDVLAEHVPALHVQVDAVGATGRVDDRGRPLADAPPRPAFAVGRLQLPVSTLSRTLSVATTPRADTVEPGEATAIEVEVTDHLGRPLSGAEVAVMVVDEAVLALTGYELADPIDVFYSDPGSGVDSAHSRSSIVLADPGTDDGSSSDDGAGDGATGGEDGDFGGDNGDGGTLTDGGDPKRGTGNTAEGAIEVRTDFDAVALFAPEELTGEDGRLTVAVTMPDNLTRYRVMAVAVHGNDRFGLGESTITARLPLMARPAAPRFANFGDVFDLPIVVQNQTDTEATVSVVLQTANLTLRDVPGRRVVIPANDRVEVRFPVSTLAAGTARFRAVVAGNAGADAAEVSLPVYTPATSEAFATYGVVDRGAVVQPLLAPVDVFPQFGGLEINTSATALQALTDAVIYLEEYPYRSADAYASRILAISALRDVLDAFDAAGLPPADQLTARVRDDIAALVGLQNDDGGFGSWRRGGRSSPFRSVHAVHALVEAKANNYFVPAASLARGLEYLRGIEGHIETGWSEKTRGTLIAYALHVRDRAGDRDPAGAARLMDRFDLSVEAMAWIWPVLTDPARRAEIERVLLNRAIETAGAATFGTDYDDEAHLVLHSSWRADGVVLAALLSESPDSDLIPKVVAGLMGGRRQGRWGNIQENGFVLLALNSYFDTFEAQDPDFVARVWLGDLYAAEHEYEGRTTDRNLTVVPLAELISAGDTDLVIDKDGTGRLYYRLGLRYAPDDLDLDPVDRGFVVERTYEPVDHPGDVQRDADGTWRIKAGAEVRVRLTLVADSRRTEVALIDPLPAGLEPLNPTLVGTPTPNEDDPEDPDIWWYWSWFEHQNLRDDRAEAFASTLWGGVYEYTYVARATTPGRFVVPPAKAEEMYSPETFGRTGTDTVFVTD